MDNYSFNLIKCKAVDDLLYVFELEKDIHYEEINEESFSYYSINKQSHPNAQVLFNCIEDLNIYVPKINSYLQDFIFVKRIPNPSIVHFIELFSIDELFSPFVSQQRLNKYLALANNQSLSKSNS